jgi:hypothetical protein
MRRLITTAAAALLAAVAAVADAACWTHERGSCAPIAVVLDLPGLEADNLLAFLALLGLLRALEIARPEWRPRASWKGPPWTARLHFADVANESEVAQAAAEGVDALITQFDIDGRKNVDFNRVGYRKYAENVRNCSISAALAAALTAEVPAKRGGALYAAPLVMMFGQGHQNFLERLVSVPRGDLPSRLRKLKSPPNMRDPTKIAEALFARWMRKDDADGFRWDPEEDQRYAMRFGDPSREGAAPTVHGANRLAAIGFLSCPTAPGERSMTAVGALRDDEGWGFTWPVWSEPLSRSAIEAFLAHPDLVRGELRSLRVLGVLEVQRARRISNGKFMNVTRARPTIDGPTGLRL